MKDVINFEDYKKKNNSKPQKVIMTTDDLEVILIKVRKQKEQIEKQKLEIAKQKKQIQKIINEEDKNEI